MSYPDVVIACIEHKVSLEAFRAIEAALVKHDNNMKDYSRGWLITITANHSNYFSLWQSQHAVCHCQESGKNCNSITAMLLVIKWIAIIVLFGGKNAGCSFFITFNWAAYALFSDVSLRRVASMTQAEKSLDPFAQERC